MNPIVGGIHSLFNPLDAQYVAASKQLVEGGLALPAFYMIRHSAELLMKAVLGAMVDIRILRWASDDLPRPDPPAPLQLACD